MSLVHGTLKQHVDTRYEPSEQERFFPPREVSFSKGYFNPMGDAKKRKEKKKTACTHKPKRGKKNKTPIKKRRKEEEEEICKRNFVIWSHSVTGNE